MDTAEDWLLCGRSWPAGTTRSRRGRWGTRRHILISCYCSIKVTIAKTDCTLAASFCSSEGVTGYPTLKFYKNGFERAEGVKYQGNRDIASLEKFIKEKLGLEIADDKLADESDQAVVEDGLYILSSASFGSVIGQGDTFIQFYAPWCGQCQRMARTWEDLARSFEKDDQVKIGELDCIQYPDICREQEVKGYPTLLYFRWDNLIQLMHGVYFAFC